MEDSVKRVTTREPISFECEPCAEEDNLRAANGLCLECDQFMCTECFQHHRKGKFCKDHELGDLTGRRLEQRSRHKGENNGETCEEHLGETVKFYCPEHVQVGCGDCMILKHKTCKVEYIRKKVATLKETEEFQSFNSIVDKSLKEVAELKIDIKETKVKTEGRSVRFRKDIETFRDKLISHINKLANVLLLEGEKAFSEAKSETLVFETECEELSTNISILKETTDVHVALPQKQFIATIKSMPKLKTIEERLSMLQEKRIQKCYFEFLFNPELKAVTKCSSIGRIRKFTDDVEDVQDFTDDTEDVLEFTDDTEDGQELTDDKEDVTDGGKETFRERQQLNMFEERNSQLLIERQLRAEHICVDGCFLTYVDNGKEKNGIYVDGYEMKNGRYFEVEIICWGPIGAIGVGIVPRDYPRNRFPGWEKYSVAYHADDGKLYFETGFGKKWGPVCKTGDKIGCGFFTISTHPAVYFTCNGVKIGHALLSHGMMKKKLYPAVGLDSDSVKVKVCLDAKVPVQNS